VIWCDHGGWGDDRGHYKTEIVSTGIAFPSDVLKCKRTLQRNYVCKQCEKSLQIMKIVNAMRGFPLERNLNAQILGTPSGLVEVLENIWC
jgi:hypothetical protein